MKKSLFFIGLILLVSCATDKSSNKDIVAIKKVLHTSAEQWSSGSLEGFMDAYWKSDSLQFIGSRGITYGWQNTLDNYKKGYPTKDHTGKLSFNILKVNYLAKNLYAVVGTYHLERVVGEADGIYTLIVKKINNKWVIISDHSE